MPQLDVNMFFFNAYWLCLVYTLFFCLFYFYYFIKFINEIKVGTLYKHYLVLHVKIMWEGWKN